MLFEALQDELDIRAAQGLLRHRYELQSAQGTRVKVDGKSILSFSSNDYLGLAYHRQLLAALQVGTQQYGLGAGASHLVSGHFIAHDELEQALAAFVGKPAALLFSSGYLANLGAVQALVGRRDRIFADKLNHASLNDAMLLSRAQVHRYRHNDMAHLAQLLGQPNSGRKLVITDAVFSMDGDLAPLPELLALCEQHDAWLLVDDAHGFGILGEQGRGSLFHHRESTGLASPRIIYMATLGKAVGVSGAFIAAEQVVIDTLVQNARSYIYTTASPPALSCAVLASLRLLQKEEWRRTQLWKLVAQLRAALAGLPWVLMHSDTPIQPLLVGDNNVAVALSEGLRKRDIWVPAIRPPTVPQGTARLRISLSAAHSEQDVAQLISALHELAH
jgi:8-amino-7-oxononanoate synthase